MKIQTLTLLLCMGIALQSKAQFGLAYYTPSPLSYSAIGVNYQFGKLIKPEIRIHTIYNDATVLETVMLLNIVNNANYSFYAGLGLMTFFDWGWRRRFYGSSNNIEKIGSLPIGISIFPFENKNLGFQMEANLIGGADGLGLLTRGGIQYRFN